MNRYGPKLAALLLLMSTTQVLAGIHEIIQDRIAHDGWYLTTASEKDGPSQARVAGADGTSFALFCKDGVPAISVRAVVSRSGIIGQQKMWRSPLELRVELKKRSFLSSVTSAFDSEKSEMIFGELVKSGYVDAPPDESTVVIVDKQAAKLIGQLNLYDALSFHGEGLGQGLAFTLRGSADPIGQFLSNCPFMK